MPFFIRADHGTLGNFEVVTDNPRDSYRGLIHRWRNNDAAGLPWNFSGQLWRRRFVIRKPAVIQEQPSRKLNVIAIVTSGPATTFLGFFERENNPTWAWQDPVQLPQSETFTYSGNPVLAQNGAFLEVYAPVTTGGWARWQRNPSEWVHTGVFQTGLGRVDALALVITRAGRFEMLIRRGTMLAHLGREMGAGEGGWSVPRTLYDSAIGVPALIQSRFGRNGNFEVVTANGAGGLTGLWADNDAPNAPVWSGAFVVAPRSGDPGDPVTHDDEVALVQSNFGMTGNYELLARRFGKTDFFWRIDMPPWTWSGPYRIAIDPADTPVLLRRTDTLERRLSGCQDLRNSILWETATGELRPYDAWTREQKDRLNDLFARILAGVPDLGVRCPNASANLSLTAPIGVPVMFLTAEEAFDLYAAHVAHVFFLEATRAVPWSILDLPALELAELLFSNRYHTRILDTGFAPAPYYPAHIRPNRDFQQPYRTVLSDVTTITCDPRVPWRFIRGIRSTARRDKLGGTEEETVGNLTLWVARNVGHGGPPHDGNRDAWIRRSRLQDQLRLERREFGATAASLAWASAGCHSAANLMHELARGANIPLLCMNTSTSVPGGGVHAGLVFRFQRSGTRVMQHADDMYALSLAPIHPVFADGTRVPDAEFARVMLEAMWTRFEDLPRAGYEHPASYDFPPLPAWDRPHIGVFGGTWGDLSQTRLHLYEKRYLLGSWYDYLEWYCNDTLTLEELERRRIPSPRSISELRLRAAASVGRYGGCSAVGSAADTWTNTRGDDTWTDS